MQYIKSMKTMKELNSELKKRQEKLDYYKTANLGWAEYMRASCIRTMEKLIAETMAERAKLVGAR